MIFLLIFKIYFFFQNFLFLLFAPFVKSKNKKFNKVQFIISVTLMEDRMTSSRHALMNWATHVLQ